MPESMSVSGLPNTNNNRHGETGGSLTSICPYALSGDTA
jgi:hypothetical protein